MAVRKLAPDIEEIIADGFGFADGLEEAGFRAQAIRLRNAIDALQGAQTDSEETQSLRVLLAMFPEDYL